VDSVSIDVTDVNVCDDEADVDSAGVVSVTVDVAVDDDSATIQLCLCLVMLTYLMFFYIW